MYLMQLVFFLGGLLIWVREDDSPWRLFEDGSVQNDDFRTPIQIQHEWDKSRERKNNDFTQEGSFQCDWSYDECSVHTCQKWPSEELPNSIETFPSYKRKWFCCKWVLIIIYNNHIQYSIESNCYYNYFVFYILVKEKRAAELRAKQAELLRNLTENGAPNGNDSSQPAASSAS